jgi:hypothetical protein
LVTTGEKYDWDNKGTYSKPSGGIPATDLDSAVQTSLGKADTAIQDISGKQDVLTAGSNITITNNVISATNTTYTAGANISIDANNEISATNTTYSAGTNITIDSNNQISATDTTYSNFVGTDGTTAGSAGLVPGPLVTDDGKFLKADGTWATPSSGAQYTAGDYIDITNNEISVTGIVSTGGGGTSLTLVEGQYYEVEYTGDEPQLITEANSGYYMVENTTNANKKVAIQFSSAINNDLYVQYMAGKAYVNYGTLLTLPMEPDYSLQMVDKNDELSEYDDTLIWKDGTVYSEGVYVTDDAGRLVTYNEIGDCYKQSSREYIDTNSHFDASWILDVTGEIIGVCFTQLQY